MSGLVGKEKWHQGVPHKNSNGYFIWITPNILSDSKIEYTISSFG